MFIWLQKPEVFAAAPCKSSEGLLGRHCCVWAIYKEHIIIKFYCGLCSPGKRDKEASCGSESIVAQTSKLCIIGELIEVIQQQPDVQLGEDCILWAGVAVGCVKGYVNDGLGGPKRSLLLVKQPPQRWLIHILRLRFLASITCLLYVWVFQLWVMWFFKCAEQLARHILTILRQANCFNFLFSKFPHESSKE